MRNKQRTIKKKTVPIIYGDDGKSRKCNFKLILTSIFIATCIFATLRSKGYIKRWRGGALSSSYINYHSSRARKI